MQHEINQLQGIDIGPVLVFGLGDKIGIQQPRDDMLVITTIVANYDIARILVDTGSSADVIYLDGFRQLNLHLDVQPVDTCLVGFSRETLQALGEVTMPVSLVFHPARAIRGIGFLF